MNNAAVMLKNVRIPKGYVPDEKTQLWAVQIPDVDDGKYDGAGELSFYAVKNESQLRKDILKSYLGDEPDEELDAEIESRFDEDWGHLIVATKIGMWSLAQPSKKGKLPKCFKPKPKQ